MSRKLPLLGFEVLLVSLLLLALAGAAAAQAPTDADLFVQKIPPPAFFVGAPAPFTIIVTNQGPGLALNVLLTDPLPPFFVAADFTLPPGGSPAPWPGSLNLGTLLPGQTVQVMILATAGCPPTCPLQVPNTATVVSVTPDPNPLNNISTAQVQIIDPFPPQIVCPADIITVSDPNLCSAAITVTTPIVTDTCLLFFTGLRSDGQALNAPYPVGDTIIVWTAVDACNNRASCSQLIRVFDVQPPTVTCPADITVPSGRNQCDALIPFVGSATDNCDLSVALAYSLGGAPISSPHSFPVGVHSVRMQGTDDAGNTAVCTFTVDVRDTQPPLLVCPSDITVSNAPGQCGAPVSFNAVAQDNCGPLLPRYYITTTEITSPYFFPVGLTAVRVEAMDGAGNQAFCNFSVTVLDTQPPTLVCPANITVGTDVGVCSATVAFTATVIENCPGVTLRYYIGATEISSPHTFPLGPTGVVARAVDNAGNQAACSFTVTVNDAQSPTLVCPANITLSAAPNECSAPVTFTATAQDLCSPPATIRYYLGASEISSPHAFPVGVNPVRVEAADIIGNRSVCTFTVTVRDTQPPTLVCPPNISLPMPPDKCAASVTFAGNASDNCPGVTVRYTLGGSEISSPHLFPEGVHIVTGTATDAAGNSASCTFTVTVVDTAHCDDGNLCTIDSCGPNGDCVHTPVFTGMIRGFVFQDINPLGHPDGHFQPALGDTRLGGSVITLLDLGHHFIASTPADGGGNYAFYNVAPGRYILQETNPPGFPENSTPNEVLVTMGQNLCCAPVFFGDYVVARGPACPCLPAFAFNSERDGNWEIYIADPTQPSLPTLTLERNLTNSPGDDREYSFTTVETPTGIEPRGAFQSDRDGNLEIYTLNPLTGEQINQSRNAASDQNPSWNTSCPGHLIAFESNRDGNWEIYIVDATSGFQRNLTRSRFDDLAPQWSPDDKWIAFQSHRDRNWEIYVVNVGNGVVTRVTTDAADDVDPAWSPDGQYLLFRSNRDGNWEIYRAALDTSGSRATALATVNLTNHPADERNYVWQPGAAAADIAFQSDRAGNWDLFLMAADGGNIRQLTTDPADDEYPMWGCANAADLFFQSNRDGNWEIYKYQGADGSETRWTYHPAADRYPVWRPAEIRWSDEEDAFVLLPFPPKTPDDR